MVCKVDSSAADQLELDLKLRRNDDVVAAVGCASTAAAMGALLCAGPQAPIISGPAFIALIILLLAGSGAAIDANHANQLLREVREQRDLIQNGGCEDGDTCCS